MKALLSQSLDTSSARPYIESVNVTLSIDDEILARARELASRQGTSVDRMIRDYLESLASEFSPEEIAAELDDLWATSSGDSGGRRWSREDLHERADVR